MQMPSSNRDAMHGLFDITLPDFMNPGTWFSSSTPPATAAVIPAPTDTAPSSFWSNLPGVLTAGLNTYAAVQMAQNPSGAIARMYSAPAGVTSQNPYGIPSGQQLPPGVTPSQYGYPPAYFQPAKSSILPLILVGAGGLLLIAMMGKR